MDPRGSTRIPSHHEERLHSRDGALQIGLRGVGQTNGDSQTKHPSDALRAKPQPQPGNALRSLPLSTHMNTRTGRQLTT